MTHNLPQYSQITDFDKVELNGSLSQSTKDCQNNQIHVL